MKTINNRGKDGTEYLSNREIKAQTFGYSYATVTVSPQFVYEQNEVWSLSPEVYERVAPLYEEVKALLTLKHGWDEEEASSINTPTAECAIELLINIYQKPRSFEPNIVPMFNGGIQIEWHNEKDKLEFRVEKKYYREATDKITVYVSLSDGRKMSGTLKDCADLLLEFLERLGH